MTKVIRGIQLCDVESQIHAVSISLLSLQDTLGMD